MTKYIGTDTERLKYQEIIEKRVENTVSSDVWNSLEQVLGKGHIKFLIGGNAPMASFIYWNALIKLTPVEQLRSCTTNFEYPESDLEY